MVTTNGSRTHACPSSEELYAFCVGRLAAETLTAISDHIQTCDRCAATLDGVDDRSDPTLAELRHPPAQEVLTEAESRRVIELVEALATRTVPPTADPVDQTTEFRPPSSPGPVGGEQLGQYVLLEQLGAGGMGQVYKARHVLMGRTVAIKLIHGRYFNHPGVVQRFLREIRALGQLDHPNIVRAEYADQVGDTHFLVMEYVAGTDLSRLVRQRGPLPVAEACEYVRQAALGLQHAHEAGLVHRDIKPSNLLVAAGPDGGEGLVKVLDLGLAAFHEEQPAAEDLTVTGQVMGTADYMAPEQWENSHAVDIRADLYSLGCTLFYLLTGGPPYSGPGCSSMLQKMRAHVEAPIPPVRERRPDVPDGLVTVLDRLLAKDPAGRYSTPAEAAEALAPFAAGAGQPTAQRSPTPRLSVRVGPPQPAAKALVHPGGKRTIGCSLQLAITLSAVLLVVGAGMVAWRVGHAPQAVSLAPSPGPAMPADQTRPLPFHPLDVLRAEKPRIEALRISHHRGNPSAEIGTMGVSSLSARLDDDVRVQVRLNRPAYCYLIAFNADGKEQLCYPADRTAAPARNDGFDYPRQPTLYFPLNDGVGLQAFVLLVSNEPLPSYEQWKAVAGAAPWRGGVRSDGFWRFDGRDFLGGPRGAEVERQPLRRLPQVFEDLCHFLKNRPGVDAIEAVAFPVKPKE
jgi:serine/threonine protein kinase